MGASDYFSQSFPDARLRFVEAVVAGRGELVSYENPRTLGPSGETLTTNVALFGRQAATKLLILISGTHGVEGFCGSACQSSLVAANTFEGLDADVAVLLIHAINPFGFAWLRRVNEDNIDLNRNSVDHSAGPLPNPEYDLVHPYLIPDEWNETARSRADAGLAQFVQQHGLAALQRAVSKGQYAHPDGLFYGGRALSWSTHTFHAILDRFAMHKEQVALIDFHTGLGPPGYGEPIYTEEDADGLARARRWYGEEVSSPVRGNSSSSAVTGALLSGVRQRLFGSEVTPLALEFGTQPIEVVLNAMRAEQWLKLHGAADSEQGLLIKSQLRDAFYTDTDEWKAAVVRRAHEFTDRALKALSTPAA